MHFAGLNRLGLLGISSFGAGPITRAGSPISTGTITTPTVGSCTADHQFIYDVDPSGAVYARRLKVGEVCGSSSNTNLTTNVHNADGSTTVTDPDGTVHTIPPAVNQSSGVPGPIVVLYDFDQNEDASSSSPNAAHEALVVGPFQIPLGARRVTLHWSGLLPQDWINFIVPELAHDCSNCLFTSMENATAGHPFGTLVDFFGAALPAMVNKDLVTRPEATAVLINNKPMLEIKISLPDQPIAVVTRPDNQEVWGMFMVILPEDPSYPWDSTTNPYLLTFYWRKQPQGVWDWIKRIVGDIIQVVGDAVDAIAGAACQLLPVAAKVPSPYVMAGAVLLQLSGACNNTCPPMMTYNAADKVCACVLGYTYDATSKTCIPMPATGIPSWMWIGLGLLGVGVLVIAYRKQHPEPHKALAPASHAT